MNGSTQRQTDSTTSKSSLDEYILELKNTTLKNNLLAKYIVKLIKGEIREIDFPTRKILKYDDDAYKNHFYYGGKIIW